MINLSITGLIISNIILFDQLTGGGILTLYTISAVISINMLIGFMAYDASTQVLYRSLNKINHKYELKDRQVSQSNYNDNL